jgi:hypothetical protein
MAVDSIDMRYLPRTPDETLRCFQKIALPGGTEADGRYGAASGRHYRDGRKFSAGAGQSGFSQTATCVIRNDGIQPRHEIPPYTAPMPLEVHVIKAAAIIDLYSKLTRWFKKSGYNIR